MKLKQTLSLDNMCAGRNNSIDIIRLIAAILVIYSHSFPLSRGEQYGDQLVNITKGMLSLGGLAVGIFFLFGGFLITKSIFRIQSTKKYFKARILRIFPELFFFALIFTFLLGPILSQLSVKEYFTNGNTYKYMLNSILVIQHDLPGVFKYNVYGSVVNGALWTLPVEFCCYIMCYIAYKIGLLNKKKFILTVPFFLLGVVYLLQIQDILFWSSVFRPILLFYIGIGCYIYREYIILDKKIASILTILLVLVTLLNQVNIGMLFFFPYILFTLCYSIKSDYIRFLQKIEISYGVYLWGFPIQQIVCMMNGGKMNPYINFTITLPFALLMGVLSYYLVVKSVKRFER